MAQVIDFANWRPTDDDLDRFKAAGVIGFMRYIRKSSDRWPKALTPDELQRYINRGFVVGFNYETTATMMLGGYAAGQRDGQEALHAMQELGLVGQPVYFSCDTSVAQSQYGTVADYMRGVKTVYANAEFYGQGALGEYLVQQGLCKRVWLTNARAWAGSWSPTPNTVIWQHYDWQTGGVVGDYDVNDVIKTDWGFHPAISPAPAPTPKGHELTYFFTCKNHPYPAARLLTYITNGITYRALMSDADFNTQRIEMATQGIPAPDHDKVPDLDWATVVSHMVEVKPAA